MDISRVPSIGYDNNIYIIDIPLAIGMCILIYGLIKPISSRFSLFVIYLPHFISNLGEI